MKFWFTYTDAKAAMERLGTPRSPKWPALAKAHLKQEGWCRYCGSVEHLEVHHVLPFHLFPDQELNPANLITLCMNPASLCHLRIGHLGDWFKYNPKVRSLAQYPGPHARGTVAHDVGDASKWFLVEQDGDDLIFLGWATCFGGDADPQDNGETASGFNTKAHLDSAAVALPMDGRAFATSSRAFHEALDGSNVPRLPWLTQVEVTAGDKTVVLPVIDLGPAKYTGNVLDLTPAAARLFDPGASAVNFSATVNARIIGGARFVTPKS